MTSDTEALTLGGPRLGAHMSIADGPGKAFARGRSIGCETMQIFLRSPNRWQSPALTDEQVEEYRREEEPGDIWPVVGHSSYLINLGSPEADLWARSLGALADELARCQRLGIGTYVLHPGSHRGEGEEQGLRRVAEALDRALAPYDGLQTSPIVALEITAGQGHSLGCSFEQLATILEQAKRRERLGICFDTAHALAAGYDFRDAESYALLWEAFDRLLGLKRLCVVHLNDSKRGLGEQVDRHEHIGQGRVGLEAFRLLVNDPRLRHAPMILETPKGPDLKEDVENLAVLRGLIAPVVNKWETER